MESLEFFLANNAVSVQQFNYNMASNRVERGNPNTDGSGRQNRFNGNRSHSQGRSPLDRKDRNKIQHRNGSDNHFNRNGGVRKTIDHANQRKQVRFGCYRNGNHSLNGNRGQQYRLSRSANGNDSPASTDSDRDKKTKRQAKYEQLKLNKKLNAENRKKEREEARLSEEKKRDEKNTVDEQQQIIEKLQQQLFDQQQMFQEQMQMLQQQQQQQQQQLQGQQNPTEQTPIESDMGQ